MVGSEAPVVPRNVGICPTVGSARLTDVLVAATKTCPDPDPSSFALPAGTLHASLLPIAGTRTTPPSTSSTCERWLSEPTHSLSWSTCCPQPPARHRARPRLSPLPLLPEQYAEWHPDLYLHQPSRPRHLHLRAADHAHLHPGAWRPHRAADRHHRLHRRPRGRHADDLLYRLADAACSASEASSPSAAGCAAIRWRCA